MYLFVPKVGLPADETEKNSVPKSEDMTRSAFPPPVVRTVKPCVMAAMALRSISRLNVAPPPALTEASTVPALFCHSVMLAVCEAAARKIAAALVGLVVRHKVVPSRSFVSIVVVLRAANVPRPPEFTDATVAPALVSHCNRLPV